MACPDPPVQLMLGELLGCWPRPCPLTRGLFLTDTWPGKDRQNMRPAKVGSTGSSETLGQIIERNRMSAIR